MQNGEVTFDPSSNSDRLTMSNENQFNEIQVTPRAERGTVARNPVIVAISKISTILDGFDAGTQRRVLSFLNEQYGPAL